MSKIAQARANIVGLLAIGILSAASMLWLLWHFPRATCAATVAVLLAFGISARLARLMDSESRTG